MFPKLNIMIRMKIYKSLTNLQNKTNYIFELIIKNTFKIYFKKLHPIIKQIYKPH